MTTASQKGILVPVTATEDLTSGSRPQAKPDGVYYGTIRETRIRGLPYLEGRSTEALNKQGYTSDDIEALSLEIANLQPQEGQELPNASPYFTNPDIILRDGEHEITDSEIPDVAWQMQRSQRMLTNLAVALGAAEQVETPEGQFYAVPNEFVEALKGGEFNGTDIGFDLKVRRYATREDRENAAAGETPEKNGFTEEVKTFLPVV